MLFAIDADFADRIVGENFKTIGEIRKASGATLKIAQEAQGGLKFGFIDGTWGHATKCLELILRDDMMEHRDFLEFHLILPEELRENVLGSDGSNIETVRRSSGADIKCGQTPDGGQDFMVLCTGYLSQLRPALGHIYKLMGGGGNHSGERRKRVRPEDETPPSGVLVLEIGNHVASPLIGKRGLTINNIRRNSGAKMQITDGSRVGGNDRVVSIDGDEVQVDSCLRGIVKVLGEDLEDRESREELQHIEVTLLIQSHQIEAVLGKGGKTIERIRTETLVYIEVDKDDDNKGDFERSVVIGGGPQEVGAALRWIVWVLFREGIAHFSADQSHATVSEGIAHVSADQSRATVSEGPTLVRLGADQRYGAVKGGQKSANEGVGLKPVPKSRAGQNFAAPESGGHELWPKVRVGQNSANDSGGHEHWPKVRAGQNPAHDSGGHERWPKWRRTGWRGF